MMCARHDPDDVFVVADPAHWEYVDPRTAGALLVEDLLGSMYFLQSQLDAWQPHFDQV